MTMGPLDLGMVKMGGFGWDGDNQSLLLTYCNHVEFDLQATVK